MTACASLTARRDDRKQVKRGARLFGLHWARRKVDVSQILRVRLFLDHDVLKGMAKTQDLLMGSTRRPNDPGAFGIAS